MFKAAGPRFCKQVSKQSVDEICLLKAREESGMQTKMMKYALAKW